jgi:uncharacterized membrane protein YeaQ/YmgE (transglycosylase-associated protein family)
MDLLALLTIGILAGQAASLLSGYSLGAIGNSIAGLTGTFFLSEYVGVLFSISESLAMFAGGLAGAVVILAAFHAAEAFTGAKHR